MNDVKILQKTKMNKEEKESIYKCINQTIQGWPEWKRKACNEKFAISNYAKKYSGSN